MIPTTSMSKYLDSVSGFNVCKVTGKIEEAFGVIISANLKSVQIGEICALKSRVRRCEAEVVGFNKDKCMLMPYSHVEGLGPDTEVEPTHRQLELKCGDFLKGSILDGLGNIRDSLTTNECSQNERRSVIAPPPDPLKRNPVSKLFQTGIPAIDAFLTLGKGQRIGIFAAAGTGKSTLLGNITQHVDADVVVINLIGERGREVREFLDDNLTVESRKKAVIVYATSDQPAIVRLKSAYSATTIAEYFRDKGLNVLLVMDSVTRFARALREIGLARGEIPARGGYPPSVFAELPRLLERSGNNSRGSITALYTVLVSGDDITEPIADEVMSILDGHIILTRELAERGHYPAIDILNSKSRVMNRIITADHKECIRELLNLYSVYRSNEESIRFGFYKKGENPDLDLAIKLKKPLDSFLCSPSGQFKNWQEFLTALNTLKARETVK